MLARGLAARHLDAILRAVLRLRDLLDVVASAVDEHVAHAAHVAVVQHGRPKLRGQHQVQPVVGETAQVQVTFQVQDLVFATGSEGRPTTVHRNDACKERRDGLSDASVEKHD